MKIRRITRKAKLGHPLSLSLNTPATSGYAWVFDAGAAHEAGWRIVKRECGTAAGFGARAKDTFKIEMLKAGRSTISAELKRPWESEPVERLEIAVDVT